MGAVVRTDAGRVVVRLEAEERDLLRSLAGQLADFLAPQSAPAEDPIAAMVGIDGQARRPEDPALARLLPDAYRDDPEAAGDFRRFTERGLREAKVVRARTVADSLERSGAKVTLAEGEIDSWLGFLNDARLTLGTRLGIDDDFDDDEFEKIDPDDPATGWLQAYGWLTWLQEALVQLVLA